MNEQDGGRSQRWQFVIRNPVLGWGLVALASVLLSLGLAVGGQRAIANPGGWPQFGHFWWASWHPALQPDLLTIAAIATVQTLAYAICGTALSLVLGSIGGLFSAEVWWEVVAQTRGIGITGMNWSHVVRRGVWLVRAGLAIPRAIHEMIWGLLFVNLWGTDPLTAVLAIAIPFGAITAKVFAEILDETPRLPLTALLNSGVPPFIAFVYGLLPQALLNLLSYGFYRFECSIRSATVLGLIGAGGLGYQLLLSLQSLRYEEVWLFIDALLVLNGLVDLGSARLRRWLRCPSRLDLNARRRDRPAILPAQSAIAPPNPWPGLGLLGGLAIALVLSFQLVQPDLSKLSAPQTYRLLGELGRAALPPDLTHLRELWPLSLQTAAMSVLAIAIAGSGGMVLAFPAARTVVLAGGWRHPEHLSRSQQLLGWGLFLGVRSLLLLCRAVPAPVWALVGLYVLFPGILPGAIALGIHNLGILGRLKTEVIENLDDRPLIALQAQGAPGSLVFLYGVFPLTLPRFVAYDLYRWEVCLRETAIVGIVGAGGLGYLMNEQLSSFDYAGLVTTLGCFLVLTFGIDWLSAQARRSLR